jgi:hypothetical protein
MTEALLTIPLFVGHLGELGSAAETGVVHEYVEVTDSVEHPLHVSLDRDIARHGDRLTAHDVGEPRRRFREPTFMGVADRDDRTFFGATPRGREADSGTGRSGDEDGLALEQPVTARIRRRSAHVAGCAATAARAFIISM